MVFGLLGLFVLVLVKGGEMICVSVDSDGIFGNLVSNLVILLVDGCFVVFYLFVDNLVVGDMNGMCDVFVYD